MKLCRYIILAIMIVSIAGVAIAEDKEKADKKEVAKDAMSFKWAFIKKSSDGIEKVIDFTEKPTVKKNDQIRIYFEPVKSAYIYLYMFDVQKDLTFIFPPTPDFFDKEYKDGEQYVLPGKGKWFMMDESKGTERFYLLASSKRLKDVEKLTKKYQESDKDPELKAKLLDEVRAMGKKHSKLTSPAEKGVSIAGTVVTITRSGESAGDAIHVEGGEFYSKTLRLKHE